jgi:hypothetical protein
MGALISHTGVVLNLATLFVREAQTESACARSRSASSIAYWGWFWPHKEIYGARLSTCAKPQPAKTRMSSAKQPRPSSESAIIRLPTSGHAVLLCKALTDNRSLAKLWKLPGTDLDFSTHPRNESRQLPVLRLRLLDLRRR